MSKWNKKELENMLEDVVNELDLSEMAVEKHGQEGTAPSELVRLVLEQKDLKIRALEANFIDASKSNCTIDIVTQRSELLKGDYRQHFIDWKNKYFEYKPKLYEYKTKATNERFTLQGLHSFYKKAMLQSPFNCG